MTTVSLGPEYEWAVDLGPPRAGSCPVCQMPVFRQGHRSDGEPSWWDSDGWQGSVVPNGVWHNHQQPLYGRKVSHVALRRFHQVPVRAR